MRMRRQPALLCCRENFCACTGNNKAAATLPESKGLAGCEDVVEAGLEVFFTF